MKSLIFLLVLLTNGFLILNNSIIHVQIYNPQFHLPSQYTYYSKNFVPSGNLRENSLLALTTFLGFHSLAAIPSYMKTDYEKFTPFLNLDGSDIFFIMPNNTSYQNTLNPFSPLYYLNPLNPYFNPTRDLSRLNTSLTCHNRINNDLSCSMSTCKEISFCEITKAACIIGCRSTLLLCFTSNTCDNNCVNTLSTCFYSGCCYLGTFAGPSVPPALKKTEPSPFFLFFLKNWPDK